MSSPIVQAILEPSGLVSIVFGTILVSAQAVEIYLTFLPVGFISSLFLPLRKNTFDG